MKINTAWHDHYRHTHTHAQINSPVFRPWANYLEKAKQTHRCVQLRQPESKWWPVTGFDSVYVRLIRQWSLGLLTETASSGENEHHIHATSDHRQVLHQCGPKRQQEPVKDGSLTAREDDVFTAAVGSVWVYHFIPGHVTYECIYVTF